MSDSNLIVELSIAHKDQNKMTKTTIDMLPIEIMEVIFKQLNLKDIESCIKTCERWKQMIKEIFKYKRGFGLAKIL